MEPTAPGDREGNLLQGINPDAFYDGQILSKLWLCEELEKVVHGFCGETAISARVYGSWQAILPFLLLTRGKLNFRRIDLYEIDPTSHGIARRVLDHWIQVGQPEIDFVLRDCNCAEWPDAPAPLQVIINTSCEHISSLDWWRRIPSGVIYCLQTTDMVHSQHVRTAVSLEEWLDDLGLSKENCLYVGERERQYGDFGFRRWMVIGIR